MPAAGTPERPIDHSPVAVEELAGQLPAEPAPRPDVGGMAQTKRTPLLWTLLRRPGTRLLAVVLMDSFAYANTSNGTSSVAVMTYLLQMMLVYRVWVGSNMVPWLLLVLLTLFEGSRVYAAISQGATFSHLAWVISHSLAVVVTAGALASPGVRRRLTPLRGLRTAQ